MRLRANILGGLGALFCGLLAMQAEDAAFQSSPDATLPVRIRTNYSGGMFMATFIVVANQPLSPAQGVKTNFCEAAWSADQIAMIASSTYDRPPVYNTAEAKGDIAPDGHMSVWRNLVRYALFTDQRNEVRQESANYSVQPSGRTTQTNVASMLFKYKIGSQDGINLLDQFRKAMGSGLGRLLGDISPQELGASGGVSGSREILGKYAGQEGAWSVKYDENFPSLVREAIFTKRLNGKELLTIKNNGVIQCHGLVMATEATYVAGAYTATFHLLTLTHVDQAQEQFKSFYARVLDCIDAPVSAGIMDERGPKTVYIRR
jgi:hypothetical protein